MQWFTPHLKKNKISALKKTIPGEFYTSCMVFWALSVVKLSSSKNFLMFLVFSEMVVMGIILASSVSSMPSVDGSSILIVIVVCESVLGISMLMNNSMETGKTMVKSLIFF